MTPTPAKVTVKLAGNEVAFETGRIACLASGAVLARRGDDVVLATVVVSDTPRPGADFFPLTVEYREKLAAAGRIPGSFQRREGRISEHEVLVSRLIDRTVRSLFPGGWRHEVQIQVTVLSADPAADVVSLAILAACAALHLSPAPAAGPAGGLRIVRYRDTWVPFPSARQREEAELDFVVSVGPNGWVMVEGEASEAPEALCVEALEQAASWLTRFAKAFEELREKAGKPEMETEVRDPLGEVEVPQEVLGELRPALQIPEKGARREALRALAERWLAALPEEQRPAAEAALKAAQASIVRRRIVEQGRRIDGRGPRDIRPIWCETGWLPRTHGSAIFTRGETQALVSCTLGSLEDAQTIEDLGGLRQEHFLLHYNFPPYSVNEPRPLRGPGRREIGHGHLARRGLLRLLPAFEDWPYTIRIESEISMSNGSSSMATVCGATLALFDAGVPLRRPAAGIAMGLIQEGERTVVLSDILGDEDHLGDMDFKVVGTEQGVTALQLDNKIGGLSSERLHEALEQAREARLHVLERMAENLSEPAPHPPPHAPRVHRTAIMPSSVATLIGPRGANIRQIQQSTGARVSVDDAGIVLIYAAEGRAAREALRQVQQTAGVLEEGRYYTGVVTSVRDFGAFVRINQLNEGLVPKEELDDDPRRRPQDVVQEGESVVVRVLGVDAQGRLRLSRKQALDVDEARIEY